MDKPKLVIRFYLFLVQNLVLQLLKTLTLDNQIRQKTKLLGYDDLMIVTTSASLKNNAIIGFATYPNPVSDGVLNISSASTSVKNLTIFNLLGKQVLSSRFSGVNKNIDVSSINAGMYILKVTEEGKTATKKLIIR